MLDSQTIQQIQRLRHAHDVASQDVHRPSHAKLKSRAMELTIMLGRLARDPVLTPDLVADILVTALGAANLMRLDVSVAPPKPADATDPIASLADPVGRLADAGEKTDHLEGFNGVARAAIVDIVAWCAGVSGEIRLELGSDGSKSIKVAMGPVAVPGPIAGCRDRAAA